MNPAFLLAHFDRISDAPEAILRLRQFVLELAVRGKLVDRDPKDETVSALLDRIRREKEERVKAGHMNKQGCLPEVGTDEKCFDIPKSWHWVRLGTITQVLMGQSPPGETYNKVGDGIPLINGPVEFTEGPFGKTFVNQYTTAPTNLCEEGDLLLCVRGSTTGRTNIAGFRACIGRGVAAIRPFFADEYVRLFIWRQRASIIAMGRGIAFPSVGRQQIEKLPIPLPPLGEQHRIVSKVNELMGLCDRLQAARADRENRRDRLAAASHHYLNNGASEKGFQAQARFYFSHLPCLSTRLTHIQQLRQTILNLAVRGKLVSPESAEDDARALLVSIDAERKRRIDIGQIKQPGPLKTRGNETEFDYPVPPRWIFCFVDDIAIKVTDGEHATPMRCQSGFYLLSARNVTNNGIDVSDVDYVPQEEYTRIRKRCDPDKGDILISCSGSIGRIAVVDQDDTYTMVGSAALIKLDTSSINPKFIAYTLRASSAQEQIKLYSKSTAQANLFIGAIRKLRLPLPPLAEQHRIVAKVDELMAICDRLEAQLAIAQTETSRLLEAVLHQALDSSDRAPELKGLLAGA